MMEADMVSAKGGGLAKAFGNMKGNIYMQIADLLIKSIEFGIGKATEYTKVAGENLMRSINASVAVNINQMKAGLDSWQDAVMGAYSSQLLAAESQMELLKAQNANTLASYKLENTWTNWIPIWGAINKYNEAALEIEQQLAETRLQNASKILSQVNEFTKRTDDYLRKQDHAIHQYQALNGLTIAQTQLFEKRMLANGEAFAKFNKTIENALKIQNTFTEQSGRAVNYSDSDYTKSFAVGRLVGEDNLTQFQAMMNVFNSSVSSSADIMYDMYNYANKMGLSQQKLTKNVLANMKLANKYDFKNGSKGFIELAKWAENARVSLGSIGSAIEKVQSGGLEGVMKQSAGLQVLGGGFAMYSDPIRMMWNAGSAPEDYMKDIQSMLKGYGSFNKETGQTTFTLNENMTLRAASEQLGIPVEELKDMARGSRQKEYVKAQMGGTTLSRENQEAIANKAQYDQETKRWYVNTISGGKMDVADVTNETMSQVLSNNKEENAEKYAQGTFGAVEKIERATAEINAKLGKLTFDNFQSTVKTDIDNLLTAYNQNTESIVKAIELNRAEASKSQKELLDKLKGIDKTYADSLITIKNKGKQTEEQKGNELREHLKNGIATNTEYSQLKSIPKYRKGLTEEEQMKIYEKDNRSFWTKFGDWLTGYDSSKSSWRSDENTPTSIKNKESARKEKDRQQTQMWDAAMMAMDAVSYGNGQPMAVSAADVVPVHDGTAKLAKTDPQDTAIFAKTGGPFDKLFNDVFGRIDDVYKMIGGSTTSNARYGDTIHTNGVTRGNEKSIKEQIMFAKLAEMQGISYNEMKSIAEPREIKNATEIKGTPSYQRGESGMISPSSFDKPIDVNIHGDITLKSTNGQSFDISKALESDPLLVRTISQLITKQLSESTNGGRGSIVGARQPY